MVLGSVCLGSVFVARGKGVCVRVEGSGGRGLAEKFRFDLESFHDRLEGF